MTLTFICCLLGEQRNIFATPKDTTALKYDRKLSMILAQPSLVRNEGREDADVKISPTRINFHRPECISTPHDLERRAPCLAAAIELDHDLGIRQPAWSKKSDLQRLRTLRRCYLDVKRGAGPTVTVNASQKILISFDGHGILKNVPVFLRHAPCI